ncbi:hypothetical protein CH75_06960 [Dyella jiangningensis]|nr:hypothetical protein CH75_06960 [Dyella jiangningensis]
MLSYLPLAVGALAWLVGGNLILYRVTRREGLRWPTLPSLMKLTLSEGLVLTGCFLAVLGGFAATDMLTTP